MAVRELESQTCSTYLTSIVESTGPFTQIIMDEAPKPRKLYDSCRISSCVLACTGDVGWEQHAILRRLE